MRVSRIIQRRVHALLHGSSADTELQREIEIHIQQLTKEAVAAGMTEGEARARALRDFGPVDRIQEKSRETRLVNLIQGFVPDFLSRLRMGLESPGVPEGAGPPSPRGRRAHS